MHLGSLCSKDIDLRAINAKVKDKMDREENFQLYLGAARGVGASFDRSITKSSLGEAKMDAVLLCIWQNIKCGISQRFVRTKSIHNELASEARVKVLHCAAV